MQGLNFTAIDFETANSNRASVCAVGLTKVQGGAIVDSTSWLIQPPASVGNFESRNISVHGIRAGDVIGAATWATSLPRILEFVGADVLVAHNASFDRSVLQSSCTESGFESPDLTFHCSVDLAKRLLELANNRLPTVAQALGLGTFDHHHAGADSAICAQAVIAIARTHALHTIDELWPIVRPTASSSSYRYQRSPFASELPQPNLVADPAHPLYGQVVVFTGELETLERSEAMQLVADHGAMNANNITKKTTMLIIGRQDATEGSVVMTAQSGKERKARQYIDAGQHIRAVSERELLSMLNGLSPKPAQTPAHGDISVSRPVADAQPNPILEETVSKIGTVVMSILKWVGNNRHVK